MPLPPDNRAYNPSPTYNYGGAGQYNTGSMGGVNGSLMDRTEAATKSVRDALHRGATTESVLSPTLQDGTRNPDYVKGGEYAGIYLTIGNGQQIWIRLGTLSADIYKLNSGEIRQLQLAMYNAGYYPGAYYDPKHPQVPIYGNKDDDGELVKAVKLWMDKTLKSDKTGDQIAGDDAQAWIGQIQAMNNATGGAASGGAGNVYVDNPFRVIPITSANSLRGTADKVSFDVFGRKASEDEKAKFVSMFQGQERLIGTQDAQIAQQNAFETGQNQLMAQAGQAGGGAGGIGTTTFTGTSGLVYPIAGHTGNDVTTNTYGMPWGDHKHAGIDLFAPRNTPIVAAHPGVVIKVGHGNGAGGNTVTVKGNDGRYYYYAHMEQTMATVGQVVGAGQQIGRVGDSGNAKGKGTHVHFVIAKTANTTYEAGAYDPFNELKGASSVAAPSSTGIAVPSGAQVPGQPPTAGGAAGSATGGNRGNGGQAVNYATFAVDVLNSMGITPTPEAIRMMVALFKTEGGASGANKSAFNPMNTTFKEGASGSWRSSSNAPIAIYPTWEAGVFATAQTLLRGAQKYRYQPMIDALREGNPQKFADGLQHSSFGNDGSTYMRTYGGVDIGGDTAGSLGPAGTGQVVGSANPRTYEQVRTLDPEMEAEQEFRKQHPEEAGAHDLSDQYGQFTALLSTRSNFGG